MKQKVISLFILGMIYCIFSIGQNTVLLVNGSTLNSSSNVVGSEAVKLVVNGETRSIDKDEILCIIPERGKSYTFSLKKNNKILKIAPKDINNDYEGTDIARLFAYKYYKTEPDISQLYTLSSVKSISEEEFESFFIMQHQKIKSRATISTVTSTVLLLITVPVFISTLSDIKSVSMNTREDFDRKWFDTKIYTRTCHTENYLVKHRIA